VHCEVGNATIKQHLTDKIDELTIVTNRLHQIQQDLHTYEKEHRYSNEEYFQHEQQKKIIENELTTIAHNYEKFQREHAESNEQLNKCRYDLEQAEKSDIMHKERVSYRNRKKPISYSLSKYS
jgi:chromosome segregation ATPase